MNEARHLRRVAGELVASPLIGIPLGLGALSLLLGLASGIEFFQFLGASGLLFGAGVAATIWLLRGETLRENAISEFRDEAHKNHERFLAELKQRLEVDGDARTNEYLQQLLKLHRRMRRAGIFDVHVPAEILPEIKDKTESLYRSCLSTLERTLAFWDAAQEMMTEEARQRVLESREGLIDEVGTSIHHLGATMDFLQTAKLEEDRDRSLPQMRRELEVGLEVARRVEQRMDELEQSLQPRLAD
jgi:hypothetical protein